VSPNNPGNNALNPYAASYSAGHSTCTYDSNGGIAPGVGTTMAGWFVIQGAKPGWGGANPPIGLNLMRSTDTAHNSTWWVANGSKDLQVTPNPSAAISHCHGMGYNGIWDASDMAKIPPTDYYGNSTNGTAYSLGASYAAPCNVSYDPTQVQNQCQWGLAMWNAVDNAGNTIRTSGALGSYAAPTGMLPITIFTIGYNNPTGQYPLDPVLLKRLANTQDSTSYNSGQQVGMYIQVNNSSSLSAAFEQVASSLLRLAQ
jgi:hypothetical protein